MPEQTSVTTVSERARAGNALLYFGERDAMPALEPVEIPNRSLFRQPEVCEIAKVQLFVLKTWEAEFPDLGVTKKEGAARVYRRADVELVLRLKHLLYVEGLTLAGARRKLLEERGSNGGDSSALTDVADLLGADARERILQVRRGLRELSAMLSRERAAGSAATAEFELTEAPAPAPKKARTSSKGKSTPRKKS